jgi:hypothetical protein
VDGLGYLIADYSGVLSPDQWATRAINAYDHHGADAIVAEVNNGGDPVERTLRRPAPALKPGLTLMAIAAQLVRLALELTGLIAKLDIRALALILQALGIGLQRWQTASARPKRRRHGQRRR